jgi:LysM repeat protein
VVAVAGPVPPTAPEAYPPSTKTGKRPAVSSTRAIDPARDRERERERAAAAERAHHDGPAWERSRRYEAFPTIKTRAAMPNLPRVGLLFVALLIAAAGLFFLPQFLSLGGGSGPGAAPSASVRPSASVPTSPTPEPVPTAQNYTIKQGDTLSKVAKKFHITLDELLAANKDTIKDADKIAIGDVILIPVAVPDQVPETSAAPEVSATP